MTLNDVTKKKDAEQSAEQQAGVKLVRLAKLREKGPSLTRPDGLLKLVTTIVIARAHARPPSLIDLIEGGPATQARLENPELLRDLLGRRVTASRDANHILNTAAWAKRDRRQPWSEGAACCGIDHLR